ncbi:MAG: zinc-binding dehydrogenase [Planctomycetota bacterium]|jgi:NADPH:quinone reductase-like Zn-dependent oxidoreductase
MKAVVIREHGGPEVLALEEREDPRPRADQVLIDVQAVGLNHLDLWVRKGVPGHAFPLPMIPGCDFCGLVADVGEAVDGIAVGDRVLAAPGFSCGRCRHCAEGQHQLCRHYGIFGETVDGGCAELAVVPAVNAIPMPDGMEFSQAAAFPLAFLTAWHMLVARCAIRPGEDVLVHAAGSGVGSAAVQIAKLHHARVIATAGSDAKLERAKELGADEVINYETQDWVSEVKKLTGKRGVDIVFEHVGEKTFSGSIRCLAKGGRVVTCGATTGPKLETNLRAVFFKGLSILGSTSHLAPVVDRVLPLSEVAAAHAALEAREAFGKIVLIPGDSP